MKPRFATIQSILFLLFLAASISAMAAKQKKKESVKPLPVQTEAQKAEAAVAATQVSESSKPEGDALKEANQLPEIELVEHSETSAPQEAAVTEAPPVLEEVKMSDIQSTDLHPQKASASSSSASAQAQASSSKSSAKASSSASSSSLVAQQDYPASGLAVVESSSSVEPVHAAATPHSHPRKWNEASVWYNQSLGLVNSKWSALGPGLANSSFVTNMYVTQEVLERVEAGLGVNWIRGANSNGQSEDVRSGFELQAIGKFKLNSGAFTPHLTLAMSVGSYKAWKAIQNSSSQVLYQKYAGGTLAGLTPGLGFMGQLFGPTRGELVFQYGYYFGKAARRVGGFGVVGTIGVGF